MADIVGLLGTTTLHYPYQQHLSIISSEFSRIALLYCMRRLTTLSLLLAEMRWPTVRFAKCQRLNSMSLQSFGLHAGGQGQQLF